MSAPTDDQIRKARAIVRRGVLVFEKTKRIAALPLAAERRKGLGIKAKTAPHRAPASVAYDFSHLDRGGPGLEAWQRSLPASAERQCQRDIQTFAEKLAEQTALSRRHFANRG